MSVQATHRARLRASLARNSWGDESQVQSVEPVMSKRCLALSISNCWLESLHCRGSPHSPFAAARVASQGREGAAHAGIDGGGRPRTLEFLIEAAHFLGDPVNGRAGAKRAESN